MIHLPYIQLQSLFFITHVKDYTHYHEDHSNI